MSENNSQVKKAEFKFLTYGLIGFSSSQIFGILLKGFCFHQSILFLIGSCLLVSVPGFLRWGIMQRTSMYKLAYHHIFSCFIPSLIAIGVLLAGFIVGVIAI